MRPLFVYLALFLNAVAFGQSSEITARLDALNATVSLVNNEYVQNAIDVQVANKNNHTNELLGYSALYLKDVEDSLEQHGLPHELQFLIPALSDYDMWKVSDDGGSGFWQLRYVIAKRYGLKISSYIDERRDYQRATSAAIPYIKHLYEVFGDWHSVIAAFMADEVEVNKAIRMAGGSRDYWEYHRFLPARYQHVVPNYIASVYIHSYFNEHRLKPLEISKTGLEEVAITKWLTIYQLSKALEVDYKQLKDDNAIFKKQVIPDTDKTYFIKIPFDKIERFYTLGDSIYTYQSHDTDGTVEPVQVAEESKPKTQEPAQTKPNVSTGNRLIYYTVRKGDYLGRIADLYDCRISDVKRWNKLRSDRINVGQRLKIYKPANKYSKYNKINSMSTYQKNQLIRKD